MLFQNLVHGRRLKPSWEFTTRGRIWRLHPAGAGRLVGEERDVETKVASYFCVDLGRGRALWRERSYGDPWWTGTEAIHRDVLLLHGFATPDLPEHKQVIAVDLPTGDLLWKNADVKFLSVAGGRVFAARSMHAGQILLQLDLQTGAVVHEGRPGAEWVGTLPPAGGEEITDAFRFPERMSGDDTHSASLSDLLRAARISAVGAEHIEVIDDGDKVVFGYHDRLSEPSPDRPLLRSRLALVERRSRTLLHAATIDEKVSFPQPDAFFVRAGFLYYVRDRRTLTAIALRD